MQCFLENGPLNWHVGATNTSLKFMKSKSEMEEKNLNLLATVFFLLCGENYEHKTSMNPNSNGHQESYIQTRNYQAGPRRS